MLSKIKKKYLGVLIGQNIVMYIFTNYYNNKAENERERGRGCEYW